MLRRSLLTSLFVGTLLIGINHGPELFVGEFARTLLWQAPLMYVVPFCVATWGALSNSRR